MRIDFDLHLSLVYMISSEWSQEFLFSMEAKETLSVHSREEVFLVLLLFNENGRKEYKSEHICSDLESNDCQSNGKLNA